MNGLRRRYPWTEDEDDIRHRKINDRDLRQKEQLNEVHICSGERETETTRDREGAERNREKQTETEESRERKTERERDRERRREKCSETGS